MKRTLRFLSLLVATLLLVAGCSTAEEAGQEVSEPADITLETEPAPIETETEIVIEETETETPEPDPPTGDTGDTGDTDQTIFELASENPQLSQLVAALEAAGLTDALEQAGPITVFAPNDEAFAQLDQADLTALLADPASLGDILQFHVVEGAFPSSELSDGDTLPTLAGEDLTVSVDGSTVMVEDAEVVQADIQAGNGVIHVIDTVMQP